MIKFKKLRKWRIFRNDEIMKGYEKIGINKEGTLFAKPTKIIMMVSFDKKDNKREEWLGYWDETNTQKGLSFKPRKDYPELTKYYRQIKK